MAQKKELELISLGKVAKQLCLSPKLINSNERKCFEKLFLLENQIKIFINLNSVLLHITKKNQSQIIHLLLTFKY